LVGNYKGKRPLGRSRLLWECNIILILLQELQRRDMDWIVVALDRVRLWELLNAVVKLGSHKVRRISLLVYKSLACQEILCSMQLVRNSDDVTHTNMIFYWIIPIHIPRRDQGLLESRSSLPLFCETFIISKPWRKSTFFLEIPLLIILGAGKSNCWILIGKFSASNLYCVRLIF
jgi:hypothetical protein